MKAMDDIIVNVADDGTVTDAEDNILPALTAVIKLLDTREQNRLLKQVFGYEKPLNQRNGAE